MSSETTLQSSALVPGAAERGRASRLAPVFADLRDGSGRWHLWRALAWKDIKGRYRRTVIGPFWTALSTAIFVSALGAVYTVLWHTKVADYLPYLTAGYISWSLVSVIINESCASLIEEEATLKAIRIPYSVFILRVITRNLIVFLHNLVVFLIVALTLGVHWGWNVLLLPVGLAFSLPNYFWIALLLATICARFRDVIQLVASLTQILFFVTPIFWQASSLAHNRLAEFVVVTINPGSQFVDVLRAPLLGQRPDLFTYEYLLGMMIVGFGVLFLLLRRVYARVAYWL